VSESFMSCRKISATSTASSSITVLTAFPTVTEAKFPKLDRLCCLETQGCNHPAACLCHLWCLKDNLFSNSLNVFTGILSLEISNNDTPVIVAESLLLDPFQALLATLNKDIFPLAPYFGSLWHSSRSSIARAKSTTSIEKQQGDPQGTCVLFLSPLQLPRISPSLAIHKTNWGLPRIY
jgi:hypothetical protein